MKLSLLGLCGMALLLNACSLNDHVKFSTANRSLVSTLPSVISTTVPVLGEKEIIETKVALGENNCMLITSSNKQCLLVNRWGEVAITQSEKGQSLVVANHNQQKVALNLGAEAASIEYIGVNRYDYYQDGQEIRVDLADGGTYLIKMGNDPKIYLP